MARSGVGASPCPGRIHQCRAQEHQALKKSVNGYFRDLTRVDVRREPHRLQVSREAVHRWRQRRSARWWFAHSDPGRTAFAWELFMRGFWGFFRNLFGRSEGRGALVLHNLEE